MSVALQSDPALQQGHILVDGQKIVTLSPAGGLSATKVNLPNNSVTTEKIVNGAVNNAKLANGDISAAKLDGAQSGDAPIFGCRAWVNFDPNRDSSGASSVGGTGNRFIRSQGNVSSVNSLGGSIYRITFTVPMQDENYCVAGVGAQPSTQNIYPNVTLNTRVDIILTNPTTVNFCSVLVIR